MSEYEVSDVFCGACWDIFLVCWKEGALLEDCEGGYLESELCFSIDDEVHV